MSGGGAAAEGLAGRLRERIRRGGPLDFAQWMEACLYDPEAGYYMRPGRKTGAGPDADFATSPTLHPFFAECVAREAAAAWRACGRPASFQVVEFGGGEGDLARGALAWLASEEPGLARAARWVHVERSPAHRAAQRAGGDARLAWAGAMPEAPAGFVAANEFLDALPFHWLERAQGGWLEVCVGLDGDRFAEVLRPPSPRALEAAPDAAVPAGARVASMPAARAWVAAVAARLGRGRVLLVDYGDRGHRLWGEDRPGGTVRAFRGHALSGDVLADPGTQDLTASVDFALTRRWAEAHGWSESLFATQEGFLLQHGVLAALNAADRSTVEGASAYLRLRQLLLPTGLGAAFRAQRFDVRL